jgi:hypothetical protein
LEERLVNAVCPVDPWTELAAKNQKMKHSIHHFLFPKKRPHNQPFEMSLSLVFGLINNPEK